MLHQHDYFEPPSSPRRSPQHVTSVEELLNVSPKNKLPSLGLFMLEEEEQESSSSNNKRRLSSTRPIGGAAGVKSKLDRAPSPATAYVGGRTSPSLRERRLNSSSSASGRMSPRSTTTSSSYRGASSRASPRTIQERASSPSNTARRTGSSTTTLTTTTSNRRSLRSVSVPRAFAPSPSKRTVSKKATATTTAATTSSSLQPPPKIKKTTTSYSSSATRGGRTVPTASASYNTNNNNDNKMSKMKRMKNAAAMATSAAVTRPSSPSSSMKQLDDKFSGLEETQNQNADDKNTNNNGAAADADAKEEKDLLDSLLDSSTTIEFLPDDSAQHGIKAPSDKMNDGDEEEEEEEDALFSGGNDSTQNNDKGDDNNDDDDRIIHHLGDLETLSPLHDLKEEKEEEEESPEPNEGRSSIEIPFPVSVADYAAQFDKPNNTIVMPDRSILPRVPSVLSKTSSTTPAASKGLFGEEPGDNEEEQEEEEEEIITFVEEQVLDDKERADTEPDVIESTLTQQDGDNDKERVQEASAVGLVSATPTSEHLDDANRNEAFDTPISEESMERSKELPQPVIETVVDNLGPSGVAEPSKVAEAEDAEPSKVAEDADNGAETPLSVAEQEQQSIRMMEEHVDEAVPSSDDTVNNRASQSLQVHEEKKFPPSESTNQEVSPKLEQATSEEGASDSDIKVDDGAMDAPLREVEKADLSPKIDNMMDAVNEEQPTSKLGEAVNTTPMNTATNVASSSDDTMDTEAPESTQVDEEKGSSETVNDDVAVKEVLPTSKKEEAGDTTPLDATAAIAPSNDNRMDKEELEASLDQKETVNEDVAIKEVQLTSKDEEVADITPLDATAAIAPSNDNRMDQGELEALLDQKETVNEDIAVKEVQLTSKGEEVAVVAPLDAAGAITPSNNNRMDKEELEASLDHRETVNEDIAVKEVQLTSKDEEVAGIAPLDATAAIAPSNDNRMDKEELDASLDQIETVNEDVTVKEVQLTSKDGQVADIAPLDATAAIARGNDNRMDKVELEASLDREEKTVLSSQSVIVEGAVKEEQPATAMATSNDNMMDNEALEASLDAEEKALLSPESVSVDDAVNVEQPATVMATNDDDKMDNEALEAALDVEEKPVLSHESVSVGDAVKEEQPTTEQTQAAHVDAHNPITAIAHRKNDKGVLEHSLDAEEKTLLSSESVIVDDPMKKEQPTTAMTPSDEGEMGSGALETPTPVLYLESVSVGDVAKEEPPTTVETEAADVDLQNGSAAMGNEDRETLEASLDTEEAVLSSESAIVEGAMKEEQPTTTMDDKMNNEALETAFHYEGKPVISPESVSVVDAIQEEQPTTKETEATDVYPQTASAAIAHKSDDKEASVDSLDAEEKAVLSFESVIVEGEIKEKQPTMAIAISNDDSMDNMDNEALKAPLDGGEKPVLSPEPVSVVDAVKGEPPTTKETEAADVDPQTASAAIAHKNDDKEASDDSLDAEEKTPLSSEFVTVEGAMKEEHPTMAMATSDDDKMGNEALKAALDVVEKPVLSPESVSVVDAVKEEQPTTKVDPQNASAAIAHKNNDKETSVDSLDAEATSDDDKMGNEAVEAALDVDEKPVLSPESVGVVDAVKEEQPTSKEAEAANVDPQNPIAAIAHKSGDKEASDNSLDAKEKTLLSSESVIVEGAMKKEQPTTAISTSDDGKMGNEALKAALDVEEKPVISPEFQAVKEEQPTTGKAEAADVDQLSASAAIACSNDDKVFLEASLDAEEKAVLSSESVIVEGAMNEEQPTMAMAISNDDIMDNVALDSVVDEVKEEQPNKKETEAADVDSQNASTAIACSNDDKEVLGASLDAEEKAVLSSDPVVVEGAMKEEQPTTAISISDDDKMGNEALEAPLDGEEKPVLSPGSVSLVDAVKEEQPITKETEAADVDLLNASAAIAHRNDDDAALEDSLEAEEKTPLSSDSVIVESAMKEEQPTTAMATSDDDKMGNEALEAALDEEEKPVLSPESNAVEEEHPRTVETKTADVDRQDASAAIACSNEQKEVLEMPLNPEENLILSSEFVNIVGAMKEEQLTTAMATSDDYKMGNETLEAALGDEGKPVLSPDSFSVVDAVLQEQQTIVEAEAADVDLHNATAAIICSNNDREALGDSLVAEEKTPLSSESVIVEGAMKEEQPTTATATSDDAKMDTEACEPAFEDEKPVLSPESVGGGDAVKEKQTVETEATYSIPLAADMAADSESNIQTDEAVEIARLEGATSSKAATEEPACVGAAGRMAADSSLSHDKMTNEAVEAPLVDVEKISESVDEEVARGEAQATEEKVANTAAIAALTTAAQVPFIDNSVSEAGKVAVDEENAYTISQSVGEDAQGHEMTERDEGEADASALAAGAVAVAVKAVSGEDSKPLDVPPDKDEKATHSSESVGEVVQEKEHKTTPHYEEAADAAEFSTVHTTAIHTDTEGVSDNKALNAPVVEEKAFAPSGSCLEENVQRERQLPEKEQKVSDALAPAQTIMAPSDMENEALEAPFAVEEKALITSKESVVEEVLPEEQIMTAVTTKEENRSSASADGDSAETTINHLRPTKEHAITDEEDSPKISTSSVSTCRFAILCNPAEPVLSFVTGPRVTKASTRPQALGSDPMLVSLSLKEKMAVLEESGTTRFTLWAASNQVWLLPLDDKGNSCPEAVAMTTFEQKEKEGKLKEQKENKASTEQVGSSVDSPVVKEGFSVEKSLDSDNLKEGKVHESTVCVAPGESQPMDSERVGPIEVHDISVPEAEEEEAGAVLHKSDTEDGAESLEIDVACAHKTDTEDGTESLEIDVARVPTESDHFPIFLGDVIENDHTEATFEEEVAAEDEKVAGKASGVDTRTEVAREEPIVKEVFGDREAEEIDAVIKEENKKDSKSLEEAPNEMRTFDVEKNLTCNLVTAQEDQVKSTASQEKGAITMDGAISATKTVSTSRFAIWHNPSEPVPAIAKPNVARPNNNAAQPLGTDPMQVSSSVRTKMTILEESGVIRHALWAVHNNDQNN
ncbi:hypothetical protein ACA910_013424 [Epithemia clementina (nom. ined.)]